MNFLTYAFQVAVKILHNKKVQEDENPTGIRETRADHSIERVSVPLYWRKQAFNIYKACGKIEKPLMPPKGEFTLLPLNADARAAANMWTPAQDVGNECRAYGAAVIMRVPGRLHIHWADDNTLEVDTDAGKQTRLFHFGASARPTDTQPTWQGYSVATWAGTPISRVAKVPGPEGDLRVVTTQMKAGYLRKNGAPYSEKATLEEYFDTFTEPDNNSWLVVTSIVTDPQYLTDQYAYTLHFKKIPDGQGWDPAPCVADEVR